MALKNNVELKDVFDKARCQCNLSSTLCRSKWQQSVDPRGPSCEVSGIFFICVQHREISGGLHQKQLDLLHVSD